MKSTIHELIVYAYGQFKDNAQRADYIAQRMSQVYNKVEWSCIFGKSSSIYGYSVWHITSLYYTYYYKSITWAVYVGTYN